MATPLYATVLNQINSYIVANGDNEITANVLNPILQLITDFSNNNIGDLNALTTNEINSIVDAVNSLKQNFDDLVNNGVQLHTGIDNPNAIPPPTYNYADFYMQLDIDSLPVKLWQWNGFDWIDSSVTQEIREGITDTSPSEGRLFNEFLLKENVANKSDIFTVSSSTTYASTKALVDGLNTKQGTILNPVTGTGTASPGQVSFWSSGTSQLGDVNFTWDNVNKRLGIGTTVSPMDALHLQGYFRLTGNNITTSNSLISELRAYAGSSNQFKTSSIKFLTGAFVDQGEISFNTSISGVDIERMLINDAGKVLIGTNAVVGDEALRVNGKVEISAGTAPGQAVNKAQLDALASSGVYTPTFTAIANITSTTLVHAYYQRMAGDVVSVSMCISVQPTANITATSFYVTLPFSIVSSFPASANIGQGVAIASGSGITIATVKYYDSTKVVVEFPSVNNVMNSFNFNFMYKL